MLALLLQLVGASAVPFASATAGGVDALLAASICHAADAGIGGHDGTPARHHSADCAVCPICQTLAQVGLLLSAPAAVVASPLLLVAHRFLSMPARAPAGGGTGAAQARAPPLPI